MKRIVIMSILLLSLFAGIAYAVDTQIVPGERISTVRIGKSLDYIKKQLGAPTKKYFSETGISLDYKKYDLYLSFDHNNELTYISTYSKNFSFQGLKTGADVEKIYKIMGKPERSYTLRDVTVLGWPSRGISVNVNEDGHICNFSVSKKIPK